MARARKTKSKTKSSKKAQTQPEVIEDAEVVVETATTESETIEAEIIPTSADGEQPDPIQEEQPEDTPISEVPESEEASNTDNDATSDDAKPADPPDQTDIPPEDVTEISEAEKEPSPRIESTPSTSSSGGNAVLPMVIGGMIAAGIGYAVPTFLLDQTAAEDQTPALEAKIEALDNRLQDAQGQLSTIDVPDIAPINSQIEAHTSALADLAANLDTLGTQLNQIDQRLAAVEARPVGETGVTEGDLAALRETLEAQRSESAALSDELAQLAAAQAAGIENAETEALNAARAAEQAALRDTLRAALANGSPFAEAASRLDPPLPEYRAIEAFSIDPC